MRSRRDRYPSLPPPSPESDSSEEAERVITIRSRGTVGRPQTQVQPQTTSASDGWVKTRPSKQDEINAHPERIKEKLFDFERIPPEKYEKIEDGTYIRYIKYDKHNRPQLRLGGYLIKNGYPDYWVLKAGSKGRRPITWSVPLKGNPKEGIPANQYYSKKGLLHSREDRTRYGVEVYDALKSGRYMLVPTDVLEGLTGELLPGRSKTRRRRSPSRRIQMEDPSSEEEERVRIVARFRDDSDSRRTSSEGGW
jgi:hypothetical protein